MRIGKGNGVVGKREWPFVYALLKITLRSASLRGSPGVLGVLFNKTLLLATDLYSRIAPRYSLVAAAITGAVVGLIGSFSPFLIGSGGSLADLVLNGRITLLIIPLFFIIRFFLTTSNYGTGVPGGIFAPLLVLGALLGLAIG